MFYIELHMLIFRFYILFYFCHYFEFQNHFAENIFFNFLSVKTTALAINNSSIWFTRPIQ